MKRLAALLAMYFSVLAIVCASDAMALGVPGVAPALERGARSCHEPAAPALPAEEPAAGGSACERHCASLAAGVAFAQATALPLVAAAWAPSAVPLRAPASAGPIRRAATDRHHAPPGDLVLLHASFRL